MPGEIFDWYATSLRGEQRPGSTGPMLRQSLIRKTTEVLLRLSKGLIPLRLRLELLEQPGAESFLLLRCKF